MKLLKHVNNTDVAIEVVRLVSDDATETLSLTVLWWNIGKCHAPYPMGIKQTIFVPIADWHKWEPYEWP